MAYVTTHDNVQLYYKDWGTGRPVILMHGWPLSSDSFDDLSLAIANAGMRAIAYDRRGFGRSDQPWNGYDYDTFADDLAAVIEHTGADNAALVGFSMGGGEVARYMARHGGARVSKVAFISAVTPFLQKTADNPDGVDESVFAGMIDGIRKDRPDFLTTFGKQFFNVGLLRHPVSDATLDWSRGLALPASPKATVDCVRAFSGTDFREDLKTIKVPVLIIHGDADNTVPNKVSGARTAQMMPGAQYMVYEGAPHGLYVTHHEELNRDLVAFIKGA